jgi:hypothetical protein
MKIIFEMAPGGGGGNSDTKKKKRRSGSGDGSGGSGDDNGNGDDICGVSHKRCSIPAKESYCSKVDGHTGDHECDSCGDNFK